jgi:DNA gyrase subunit A
MNHIKAPDFPTGGIIYIGEVREAFKTGRGQVLCVPKLVLKK